MLVQVQPVQIPKIWELVKFVCTQTDGIEEQHLDVYLIGLLQDLLSGKRSVYVIENAGQISFITLCSFKVNNDLVVKYFSIDNVYAFKKHTNTDWTSIVTDYHAIAKKNSCAYIAGYTTNPRIEELFKLFKFKLFTKTYYIDV